MYTATSAPKSVIALRLAAVGLAAAVVAAPASASKRNPAPIVFATGTSDYPAGEPQYIEPSRAPDADAKKKKRIEFRYPDQPQIVYGAAGARKAESAPPMAFSSSSAAVDTTTARKYASASAPDMSQPEPSYDPSLTPGSFDARATAARIDAQRQTLTVASEPLPSLAAPGPMPLQPKAVPAQTVATVTAANAPVFDETGVGIVYGDEFNGLPTANGEIFEANGLTAAHPSLPLPSLIQVTNVETGRDVVVRVNDRGPFDDGAALQVSQRAAAELGMNGAGRANLRIRYLGAAPAVDVSTASYEPTPEPGPGVCRAVGADGIV
ncbi:MAG: septal ring lytic transglycosylase RlpA family protein [Hyphomonas sp.]